MYTNKLKLITVAILIVSASAFGSIINVANTGLWAGTSLEVGRDVTISGSVASSGTMGFGRDTAVTGDIYSGGNIWIDRDSTITGNVTPSTGANLSTGSNVAVTGSTDSSQLDFSNFTTSWQSQLQNLNIGSNDVSGSKDSVTNLLAGEYKNFDFNKNTTLNLSAGNYSMQNFWMNKDSVVNLDTSAGDVTLNVLGSFSTSGNVKFVTAGTGNVYVNVYENDAWLGDSSEMRATLNVYGGDFGTGKNAELAGSFYATDNLWLGNDSSYNYISADPIPEPATILMLAVMGLFVSRKKITKNKCE